MPELLRISSERATLIIEGPASRDDVSATGDAARLGYVDVRAFRGDPPPVGRPDTAPLFFENTDYDFYLEGAHGTSSVELHHRDPRVAQRLYRRQGGKIHAGTVNFRSAVGMSAFTVFVDKQPDFELTVKVFPSKLDFESDRDDMIEELQRDLGAIALQWLSATYGFGAATQGTPTDLEWTLLLRHAVGDLERGLREVARHPRRALVREVQQQAAHRVRRPDSAVRHALARADGRRAIGALEGGVPIPRQLPVNAASSTLDTPEHRWFAARLGSIQRRLAHIQSLERARRSYRASGQSSADAIEQELAALAARVDRLTHLPPIAAAAGPPIAGFHSLQLMTAAGYGLAYRACMTLDLSLRIQDGVVEIAEKGMDRLYEYWAFLRVVRGVERAVGGKAEAQILLGVESGGVQVRPLTTNTTLHVQSARGARVAITYNPLFKGHQLTLVPQRPDVLISYEEPDWPKQHLIVDAKYRLNASPDHVRLVGQPGPPTDALNVLYRYRDAILERPDAHASAVHTVIEAAAVYPYAPPDPEAFRASRLWASLERIGVGAIPLLPGRVAWLEEWFQRTLGRGAWSLADRALTHRSATTIQREIEHAHQVALVGVVPGPNAAERLAWHRSSRMYFLPERDVPRMRLVRWVALYTPAAGRTGGRVAWIAPVQETRQARRSDLKTPWAPSRSPDEQVIVFELGELSQLPRPIENPLGLRMPPYRWATYLALSRARDVSELAIETVPEWRLHQQLLAEGVPFSVRSGDKLHVPNDEHGKGAAIFHMANDATLRHQPKRGYKIRWADGREVEALSVDDAIAHFRSSLT